MAEPETQEAGAKREKKLYLGISSNQLDRDERQTVTEE